MISISGYISNQKVHYATSTIYRIQLKRPPLIQFWRQFINMRMYLHTYIKNSTELNYV